jgi:hypothetical protein
MTLTEQAQEMLGEFVKRAGKTFLTVNVTNVFGEPQIIRITVENLAEFYATQANNLSGGCRTLAGLAGDWRPVSELANAALEYFKRINPQAMRRTARKRGLQPKF